MCTWRTATIHEARLAEAGYRLARTGGREEPGLGRVPSLPWGSVRAVFPCVRRRNADRDCVSRPAGGGGHRRVVATYRPAASGAWGLGSF
jgi:hypothetical protein